MKNLKRIGAMICAIALCFCISAPQSQAQGLLGGQQMGAWMAAGLYATSILLNSLNVAVPGHFDNMLNWVSEPTYVQTDGTFFDYNWPEPSETISEYMNRSIIKIDQGVTTIDGVEYDELWISPEGAGKVKANVFDFKTKWNILSNNAGTLARGEGNVLGVGLYNTGTSIKSQKYVMNAPSSAQLGDGSVTWRLYNSQYIPRLTFPDGTSSEGPRTISPFSGQIEATQTSGTTILKAGARFETYYAGSTRVIGIPDKYVDNTDFEYDYVSGIVPASEADIPDDYGISLKMPHDKLETFYNTYPQYNVDNTVINIEQDEVDIDELTQAIFDMIDSLDEIIAEWKSEEEPEPPIPVDPVDNIDENVESINQYQQNMNQQVNHMHEDVEAIHQLQQEQKQTQQDIAETSESIDNTLKEVKDAVKPGEITSKKFDLRRLFPFCIPFDIYNLLQKFEAEPQAPHVQIPFIIQSIGFNYMIDLDFSDFDGLAQTLRTLELIVYCIGLAWATSKVIKW